jgi:biotin carboxyl carrier protein
MNKPSFKVQVNDQTNFSLVAVKAEHLDSNEIDTNLFHVLQNQAAYKVKLIEKDFNERNYTVQIGSNLYKIQIDTELDQLIRSMGYELSSDSAANDVKAPMPGIILEIQVKPGDVVSKGDTLLILEAMKMENAILSPKDGVIKSVMSETGDTVDKNKLLIELE